MPLASAQGVPGAGGVLRETAPKPPTAPVPAPSPALPPPPAPVAAPQAPAGEVSFVLRSVSFSGNRVYSSEQLGRFAADKVGKSVTFADLESIAGRITEYYRKNGYFLAQALVPAQDVSGGAVEFSVIEGKLGKLRVNRAAEAPISDERLKRFLACLRPGEPLTERGLERAMLVLSDLPGIALQSSLEAGNEPGTTDLIVDVNARRRWDLLLDADNHGSRATGEFRVGATGRINSPAGLGDNLDLRLLTSSGNGLTYGRLAYELPAGYAGTRAGLAYTRLEYDLGKDFAALGATGNADVYELTVSHPFIRLRLRNLVARASYMEKRLEDRIDVASTVSDKRVKLINLGFAYEGRDNLWGGGYTSAGLTASLGDLDIRSAADLEVDQSAAGRHTNGHFTRANYQLSRLQALAPRSDLFLGVTGQITDKNLDSAERIALGGPNAVRAYPISEGIVDEGYVVNAEYRYSMTDRLTLSGFYDAGWGRLAHSPSLGEDNRRTLRGYGLGLFWGGWQGLTVRASLAWRDTERASSETPDRVPRLFVQVLKAF